MTLQLECVKILAALYVPLDGMNEKRLAVSVNMIHHSLSIEQNTDKPDITTTVVKLMLDEIADVDAALEILRFNDISIWSDRHFYFSNCISYYR